MSSTKLALPLAAPKKPVTCTHLHLQFYDWGQGLRCIDCKSRWLLNRPDFEVRDYTTMNPEVNLQTRHSPYVAPKMAK